MNESISLSEVCLRITKGTTPNVADGGFSPSGINYIKSESLSYDGRIDRSKFAYISHATNEKLRRSIIQENDILYSIAGANLGKCGIATPDLLPANTNQAVAIIRTDPTKVSAKFVSYCLRDPRFVRAVLNGVAQSAQPNVNLADIGRFKVPLKPLDEQKAIADVLGVLDDNIALNFRLNDTLEAMAMAIFRDWFVDFGPTRAMMEGKAPYLSSEIWSLFPKSLDEQGNPDGWKLDSVYNQAIWVNGAAYKDMHFVEPSEGLPVIKIAELKNGVTSQTKFTNTVLGEKYRISDGELLFSWSGNPDTSIDTFLWTGGDAWLNQHIFAVRENGAQGKAFLYCLLKSLNPVFAEIARNKQTTGLGHVTKKDIELLSIPISSQPVRSAFSSMVEPLIDLMISKYCENKRLVATRNLILPKLMSGEVRLKDAAVAVEAVA